MHGTAVSEACANLLERASIYRPLYGDRLSNHLPMALIALDRLGAAATHLQTFFDHYRRRLAARQPSKEPVDPLHALGVMRSFEPVLTYFERDIAKHGHEHVLRKWLPTLLPGVSASAFHSLIRLGYALDARNDAEIAAGLASWTTEYRALGSPGATTAATLDEIARSAAPLIMERDLGPGIIIDRMANVASFVSDSAIASQPATLRFEDIVAFALRAYRAREDFTLLHLVTASHAFRLILPYVQERDIALRHFWHAALMGYLSTASVGHASVEHDAASAGGWAKCLQRAAVSLDDHVIKLTYTAWQQAKLLQNPCYLYIARRKNGIHPA